MDKDKEILFSDKAKEYFLGGEYFTPDITDIRVGYECRWGVEDCILGEMDLVNATLALDDIKVSYLTKAQIEAEGWFNNSDETGYHYKNKEFRLGYINQELQIMKIRKTSNEFVGKVIFLGKCKDINTFRYILKLLNI